MSNVNSVKGFKSSKIKLLLTILLFLSSYTVLSAQAKDNPHNSNPIAKGDGQKCLSCHKILPKKTLKNSGQHIIPQTKTLVKDTVAMCTNCHADSANSHIVGVTPDYTVPADLPLSVSNKVDCLTCHYVHGSLKSDKPMASVSAMDRLFNRDRMKKSFVLRRNNSDGDLCLACHKKKEK